MLVYITLYPSLGTVCIFILSWSLYIPTIPGVSRPTTTNEEIQLNMAVHGRLRKQTNYFAFMKITFLRNKVITSNLEIMKKITTFVQKALRLIFPLPRLRLVNYDLFSLCYFSIEREVTNARTYLLDVYYLLTYALQYIFLICLVCLYVSTYRVRKLLMLSKLWRKRG